MTRRAPLLLLIFSLVFVVSCKFKDLHHNLEETDANEVLVILHENGIEARKDIEKVAGQEITWKVLVEAKRLEEARQILVANHLPRRQELGLSGVYKEKGLIPTPDEQKARFLLALKGEIINSLRKIPGVVDADVVLNIPTENEFSELDPVKKRPTASVVVRTRGEIDMDTSMTEGKIQRFVANSIPNMDPNDVAVIVTRLPTAVARTVAPQGSSGLSPVSIDREDLGGAAGAGKAAWIVLGGIKMEARSVARFKVYMIVLLGLLLVISVGLLASLVRVNRLKSQVGESTALAPYDGEPSGMLSEGSSSTIEGAFNVGNKTTK